MTPVKESLWQIEESLEQLAQMREAYEAEGDSVALKAVDIAIATYLEEREPAKINSYAALIRRYESEAAECAQESDRLKYRARMAQAEADHLKATALAVMQRFQIKELHTPTNSITRQANGGLQKLDAPYPMLLPLGYRKFTLTLDAETYIALRNLCGHSEDDVLFALVDAAKFEPATDVIRKALGQRIQCPECGGKGDKFAQDLDGEEVRIGCTRCMGAGTVQNTVPGARLLPRGERIVLK